MFTVRLLGPATGEPGRVVGVSSLGDVDLANGSTSAGPPTPEVLSTAVNPECKLLVLGHGLDDRRLGRVKIQTDPVYQPSQAAIAETGAVRECVLRWRSVGADGTWRDAVVWSVVLDEWPVVRPGPGARIAAALTGGDEASPSRRHMSSHRFCAPRAMIRRPGLRSG